MLMGLHQTLKEVEKHDTRAKLIFVTWCMYSTVASRQLVLTCRLSAMQSSVSKLTTFTKLKGLFDKLPLKILSDFFDLPDDFPISRQHDRGGCQVFDNEDGEKAFKRE